MLPRSWSDTLEQWLFRDLRDTGLLTWPVRILRIAYALVRDFTSGQLTLRATGLVYVTILSLVPALAIVFATLKGFGLHRQLRPVLDDWLMPLGEQRHAAVETIMSFVENVQGDVLAGVSLLLLFVTTLSMADRVESSFNFIWRVENSRKLARRISDYITVILVGPVIMSTALGLIAAVENSAFLRQFSAYQPIDDILRFWGLAGPYLIICLAFAFIYWFVPNTRVTLRAALVGGLIGGIAWAASGVVFTRFIATSTRTLTIYAGFAAAIISLVWLYLCWLTLLLGSQVAFYIQYPEYLRLGYRKLDLGGRGTEQVALSIMLASASAFLGRAPRPTVDGLSHSLGIPAVAVAWVASRLEYCGLIVRSDREELLPSRAPAHTTVREIVRAVRDSSTAGLLGEGSWPTEVRALIEQVDRAIDASLGELTLAELAMNDRMAEEPAAPGDKPLPQLTSPDSQ